MAKKKKTQSILDKLKNLLRRNKQPEDWADILPPERVTQYPGQEGLEGKSDFEGPFIPTRWPNIKTARKENFPQPGQKSILRDPLARIRHEPRPTTQSGIRDQNLRYSKERLKGLYNKAYNNAPGPLQKMMRMHPGKPDLDMQRLQESLGDTYGMYKQKFQENLPDRGRLQESLGDTMNMYKNAPMNMQDKLIEFTNWMNNRNKGVK